MNVFIYFSFVVTLQIVRRLWHEDEYDEKEYRKKHRNDCLLHEVKIIGDDEAEQCANIRGQNKYGR